MWQSEREEDWEKDGFQETLRRPKRAEQDNPRTGVCNRRGHVSPDMRHAFRRSGWRWVGHSVLETILAFRIAQLHGQTSALLISQTRPDRAHMLTVRRAANVS